MQNFLDPAILFFVFGLFAGLLRSNLEIPAPISRFLSLYLLMALGLKGGFALAKSGFTQDVLLSLGLAVGLALLVPARGLQGTCKTMSSSCRRGGTMRTQSSSHNNLPSR